MVRKVIVAKVIGILIYCIRKSSCYLINFFFYIEEKIRTIITFITLKTKKKKFPFL